jgi:acyl-homoserine-lactone acylase
MGYPEIIVTAAPDQPEEVCAMAGSLTRFALVSIVFTITLLLVGATDEASAKGNGKPYRAALTWTSFGIPHVRASDWGGLGYGYGYAFARDNVCTLALDVVESTGRLSRFFGPAGGNLQSDAVWSLFNSDAAAAEGFAQFDQDMQALLRGYAAGFNRYLRDTGGSALPAPCRNAEWVRPISELDMVKVLNKLTLRAGVANFIDPIFGAQPPAATAPALRAAPAAQIENEADAQRLLEQTKLPSWDLENFGSNAVALGGELTGDGGGALLGNPHFPWLGINRFHAVHLTIPGRYDAMGAAIYGFPLVSIGFNRHVAWSHTVSTARRFVLRELTLAPGDPTAYLYDGEVVPMTTQTVTVEVLQPDNSVVPFNHTFYESQFGVMLVLPPLANWSTTTAYAFTDVNVGNFRGLKQYREMGSARSIDQFRAAIESNLAIPWVNSIAADREGNAYYGDISTVPHVTDAKLFGCANSFVAQVLSSARLYTLDGSTSACDPGSDPDAPQAGLFGAGNLPSLTRRDFAQNSNNSYWLANPAQKLEGFPQIIGTDEGGRQNLRTRLGLTQIQDRMDGTDGLPGSGFGQQWLQEVLYQNRHHSAELLLPGVRTLCNEEDNLVDGVDVSEACGILLAWDATNDPDRVGPHIWRELYGDIDNIPNLYAVPFDVNDPVNTPRELNTGDPGVRSAVMSALAASVQRLSDASIPLAITWGSVHFDTRNGEIFPIHGGRGGSGVYNAISAGGLIDGVGYTPIFAGSSYIQTVRWQDDWPVVEAIVTYSQSTDPDSPHFSDMTQVFSDQEWVPFPYRVRDIKRDRIESISLFEKR